MLRFASVAFALMSIISTLKINAQVYNKVTTIFNEVDSLGKSKERSDTLYTEYFDKKGNVRKKVEIKRRDDRVLVKTILYDSRGREKSRISDYGNGRIERTDVLRDKNGFIKSFKEYEGEGRNISWVDFANKYDLKTRVLYSEMILRKERTKAGWFKTKFDMAGKIIEEIDLDSLNNEISMDKYVYSAEGNLIRKTYEKSGKIISTTEYSYDGRLKKEGRFIDADGKLLAKIRYVYE